MQKKSLKDTLKATKKANVIAATPAKKEGTSTKKKMSGVWGN
jgi:hypothetical protein